MSTEFVSTLEVDRETYGEFDDHVRFVRYAGKPDQSAPKAATGPCFEFGTMTNFMDCKVLAEFGCDWFGPGAPLGDEGDVKAGTVEWFDEIVAQGRATFGTFPITVAAGSPTMSRFTMEDPK